MAILGWPSMLVDGDHDGQSTKIYEPAWNNLVAAIHGGRAGVCHGFSLSDQGGLTVRIEPSSGAVCMINGYWCSIDFNVDVEAIDNATSYQYLRLKRNALGAVIDPGIEGYSSKEPIRHPDYLLMAKTNASDGDIIYINDAMEYIPGIISGTYSGNGTTDRTVYIYPTLSYVIPTLVMIHSTSSTDNLYAFSAIESPYNRKSYNDETPQSRVCLRSEYTEVTIANVLQNGATWNISITAVSDDTKYDTTTVTVDGALTSAYVLVNYSDPSAFDRLHFNGYVESADTVRVYATSVGADAQSYSGVVNVIVFNHEVRRFGDAIFLTGSTSDLAPIITLNGFKVSDNDQEAITLNKTGVKYNYIAFI